MKNVAPVISMGLAACLLLQSNEIVQADTKSRIPPRELFQQMLDMNKETGWVSFRNFNGKQLIYFSALQVLHCRLKEIRYSLNSEALDRTVELAKCNPQTPFSIPNEIDLKKLYISEPLGSVKTVAVQVTWEDDSKSETAIYEPCKDVGEQNCAWLLDP